jgi:outer membrane lipoprotein-sorting protein
MQVLRLAMLALLAVCAAAASGCRTAGVDELARPGPPVTANSANVAAILAEHNRNAERIQVMRARPELTVTVREKVKRDSTHPLNGRLALEQPRNFKLELYHSLQSKVGDLGSNETEYWFWLKDKTQALYYCKYEDADANPQAVAFQPDWIKEAMGLRVIPDDETNQITVTSAEPGRLILTHRPHTASGKKYMRLTILDRNTHQILEHRLLSGDKKTILARAEVPEGYDRFAPESGSSDEAVLIPKRLKLYWVQEGLELDVTFRDVRINPVKPLAHDLFVEPQLGREYTRINLAERAPGTGTATASPTTIRETRPAPPSGTGVRLRAPTSIGGNGSEAARDDGGSSGSPLAFGGEAPRVPSLTEGVVGARYPSAAEPDYLRPEGEGGSSGSNWRPATSPSLP